MSWTFDDLKARKTPAREVCDIIVDREWGQELGEAQLRLGVLETALARPGRQSDTSLMGEIEELTAKIAGLEARKSEAICRFVFKSIPSDRYERIVAANPPTKTQRAEAAALGRSMAYNPGTFPPALVHACLISPELSWDQVQEIFHPGDGDESAGAVWSPAELADLFRAAETANISRPRAE